MIEKSFMRRLSDLVRPGFGSSCKLLLKWTTFHPANRMYQGGGREFVDGTYQLSHFAGADATGA
ncbi:MAG: hypothetical protein ABUT39_17380 [Acidobacteriota bacterium]